MQLQAPLLAVTPSIDGDVLRVLGGASDWFTLSRLRAVAGAGSLEGLRRALRRLEEQGVVDVQPAGRTRLYRLNDDHLAAAAIKELAHLDDVFRERLRAELAEFAHAPRYAVLFGSAARGAMRPDSDIDLMLVFDVTDDDPLPEGEVDTLVAKVSRWTGNDCRVVLYAAADVRGAASEEPLVQSVADEGVALVGSMAAFRREVSTR